jgi:tellurite resistance protein
VSLSKNGFLAITAVAWADGLVRKDEANGLLQAARDCGLTDSELAEVSAATESRVPLDDIDLGDLSGPERALTYAFAMWLAKVDGVVNTEELAALRKLGGRLDLPDPKLQAAASAAFDIACLPGGNRPEKFEFAKLEARLKEKLPALMSGA